MWGFALHDAQEKKTFLCRDRFGVKPVYYFADSSQIVACSEIQAIDRFFEGRLPVNLQFLSRLAASDVAVFQNQTAVTGIQPLLAGHLAEICNVSLTVAVRQWYWLRPVSVPSDFDEQATVLRSLLESACKLRLRSDVPVATCLSGGIDSGSIVSILAELNTENARQQTFTHRSYTAAFPGDALDETQSAAALAAEKGMQLVIHPVQAPSPEQFEEGLRFCDGPMPSMAFYPIWELYRTIREQGVRVTLDGQGADEMLGGYYAGFQAMLGAMEHGSLMWLRDLYHTYGALHDGASNWIHNDFNTAWLYAKGEIRRRLGRPWKTLSALASDSPPTYTQPYSRPPLPHQADPSLVESGNSFCRHLLQQFFVTPLPFLLHQYDRCSMASGVECRMPFMDYRLVEFVFSLPLRSRVGGGFTKRVLRHAMQGVLPEATRTRRAKTGFNAPFHAWLTGPLNTWLLDRMNSTQFLDSEIFDGRAARDRWEYSASAPSAAARESDFWPCIHIDWWLEQRRSYRGH
jgi:asparagine synthase (glutamine-hydrolysing)